MNYMTYNPVDVVNGTGTRCSLFVSGCIHACKGCYNEASWNPKNGHPFTKELEDRIIADLQSTEIPLAGLSLSGGDPLHPRNQAAIEQLIDRVRAETTKTVWLWTGYTVAEMSMAQVAIVGKCDVFIDGKFEQECADPSLKWRGSSNQIIHVKHEY